MECSLVVLQTAGNVRLHLHSSNSAGSQGKFITVWRLSVRFRLLQIPRAVISVRWPRKP